MNDALVPLGDDRDFLGVSLAPYAAPTTTETVTLPFTQHACGPGDL
jgi:hypothetical protein